MTQNYNQIQENASKFWASELTALSKSVHLAQKKGEFKINPNDGRQYRIGHWTDKERKMFKLGKYIYFYTSQEPLAYLLHNRYPTVWSRLEDYSKNGQD